MSSNVSSNPEIDRLAGEVKKRRKVAEAWDTWNIRFLFIAGFAAICLVGTAIGVSRSNRLLSDLSDELDRAKDRALQTDLKSKDDEIAGLQRDTEAARRDAERFKLDIAKANERSADAEKKAAEANLELARIRTPRTIAPDKGAAIISAASRFPKTPFDIWTTTDPEAINLGTQIEALLLKAGWDEVDVGGLINLQREGKKPFGITLSAGLTVEINQSRLNQWGGAVEALVGALKIEGLDAKGIAALTGANPNAIHIRVGTKL